MALHDDEWKYGEVGGRTLGGDRIVFSFNRFAKRAFDIVAASIGLILLSPTLLIAAIAVKLDSRGPVFSLETLYQYKNRPIRVLKFRSVATSAEASRMNLRVTRVGRVMRECGIDGLPQLFNVLRGEMSIVGPRLYASHQDLSHYSLTPLLNDVKPGMIGITESLEGFGTTEQQIKDDLYYVENWSIFLDIKIALMALVSEKPHSGIDYNNRRQNKART
jgi:lipopolysaccharide/colanic/teichoic acid biosynthesis glycosyltransferase